MKKIGIVGGSGYVAGELLRLLQFHDEISLESVYSVSNSARRISEIHQDLLGFKNRKFDDSLSEELDVVFLCQGHGFSEEILQSFSFSDNTKVIDMSNAFRLKKDAHFEGRSFIYGLTELNKDEIKNAQNVANPGCFSTALQLALLPLLKSNLISDDVHINGVTGATGAGASLLKTTNFSWRDNNFSSYKTFKHQHLSEVWQTAHELQPSFENEIYFIPNRGNFSRGIFSTVYTTYHGNLSEAKELYEAFYENSPFVHLFDNQIHLKQVVNTNNCLLHLEIYKDKLLITSIIDNLLKGASGQAIQNMNLMCGFEETQGLKLKANYF